jgi:hypothetical protein
MYRLLALAAPLTLLTACGEIECDEATFTCNEGGPDDNASRPATLEYVTVTILKPNCAVAQCHSSFSYVKQYRFDTVEHTQESLVNDYNGQAVVPGDSNASLLFLVLIRDTQDDGSAPRMPYDQPLQTADIALVKRWIDEGADGLVIP